VKEWWRQRRLRMSLTLWYAAAMVVILAAYAASVFTIISHSEAKALDDKLRSDVRWVAEMAVQNPDGSLLWFEGDDGSGEDESPWLQVWSPGGELLLRSKAAERIPIAESAALAQHVDGKARTVGVAGELFRILSLRSMIGGESAVIQVAGSEARERSDVRNLMLILMLGLPLGVVAAGLGGYALACRALAPIDRMAERARTITAARLSDRLPVDNPKDELGRLATVFNDTLGTLESSFEQMRRFTADVSHELRTPLTAIRSVGEVGLRTRRAETSYRAVISSMLEEVDRLTGLVDRLLTLSRAESGRAKLSVEMVDLYDLALDVAGHLGVLAEEKGQTMVIEPSGRPQCFGDRLVLRQALINLVDNAIKYTPAAGHIRIRVMDSPAGAVVDVSDSGPGISADSRTRIFDRYYRIGASHAGDPAGAGLGLSIARWAAEVSGGQLTLEPDPGGGSTFRITLPNVGAAPHDPVG
jgi:heavy metal sensor kinase